MIDSFLAAGNEYFDALAFNDFPHAELTDERLKAIQSELNANAFMPASGQGWPDINAEFLTALSKKLKPE